MAAPFESPAPAVAQRLFIALPLPDTVKAQLKRVRYPIAGFAWVPPENLHLTMRFLGEVAAERRTALEARLAGVRVEPFILPVEGTGAFPPRRPPRVVWVGTGRSHPRLFQLRQRLDDALLMGGFDVDMRSFHAHVTVARLGPDTRDLANQWVIENEEFIGPPFRVEGFGLYSSLPGPEGSRYTLERWFAFEPETPDIALAAGGTPA